ncbi:hypothetical protein, partial [Paraburkholderia mimosarum]|uniref:hypothetical protein n=1 Tax=Paraburkholderia mimosarum TaxID=312026 RepID=UPI00056294D1
AVFVAEARTNWPIAREKLQNTKIQIKQVKALPAISNKRPGAPRWWRLLDVFPWPTHAAGPLGFKFA